MITSAYIHIPFCRRKCFYCTFSSYAKTELKTKYIEALCAEISKRYKKATLKKLYIGGGTPSLLEKKDVEKIISYFDFQTIPEITIEANPENLSYEKLKSFKEIGINRLSIGVQTFDNNLLKQIGRHHSIKEAFDSIKNAKKAGFENINIDLIYGLPNQNIADLSASVITACELDIQHISTYGLKIEEGSKFYIDKPKNIADEELQAQMYLKIIELTKKYNFNHYEISNFSKSGYESKHNLNYWNAENYYGFGCAACGYEDNIRYSHFNTIEKYIKNPSKLTEKEEINKQLKLEETIFLGFRKKEGINITQINKEFKIDFEKKYSNILRKYEKYILKTEKGYTLTDEGFLISNYILSDFIE